MAFKNLRINNTITEILNYLRVFAKEKVEHAIKLVDNDIVLMSGVGELVRVTDSRIILLGHDVENKIIRNSKSKNTINLKNIKEFLKNISGRIIMLNHVGMSYYCSDENPELAEYKKMLRGSFTLSEEQSNDKNTKWYFIGNRNEPETPLFELVINKRINSLNSWVPHFQVDIDSSLSSEELEEEFMKAFGSGSDWKLGPYLSMKILGEVDGTKICLGVGTSIRWPQPGYHRKEMLKDIFIPYHE